MNDSIRRRSPVAFVVLLCLLTIPFWLFGAAPLGLPVALPVGALMAFCPAVVAVALIGWGEGWVGVRRLLAGSIDPRGVRPWTWFLPIVLLVPAATAVAAGVLALSGRPQTVPAAAFLLVAVPVVGGLGFLAAVGEEAGWTGYLQDPLQERWGELGAGVVIGAVWATWHLPGWYLQLDRTAAWTAGMWVSTVALRVLAVRLRNASGGSVFAAVLFHVVVNLCSLLFPDQYTPPLMASILVVLAVLTRVVTGAPAASGPRAPRPHSAGPAS
ncbi:CPBP family intramembrane glutamic endopeptidase [Pseudonocardia sp. MH-G8]|uniref:CPBP family intramembrane glutamic endopeptidase n=1 Tax=Pseudonocardia sp. MH-G8 TaxID=1854588 RepID=UPI0013041D91|nr:CPBP family intramembrane glutamic endopeptidase [Pseudonocardia sp. MH-G8]